jgi:hypothetical protein
MSITTFAELKTALNGASGWLHRQYTDDKLEEFITLAEAQMNRLLRVRQMETSFTGTLAAGLVTRETDLVAVKAIWSTSNNTPPIEQKSLEFVLQHPSEGSIPQYYAWDRASFRFNSQSGSVAGVYYAQIPALSDSNTTNWLLSYAPDVYLAAVIAEHLNYTLDPSAMDGFAKARALIEALNTRDAADRFSGNSLVVRSA